MGDGRTCSSKFWLSSNKKAGAEGAMFGAPITRTVGELDLGKSGPMRTTLKLHRLESRAPGAPTVGIKVVNRSVLSYHVQPIRLTSEQAGALGELLSRAVADSEGDLPPTVNSR